MLDGDTHTLLERDLEVVEPGLTVATLACAETEPLGAPRGLLSVVKADTGGHWWLELDRRSCLAVDVVADEEVLFGFWGAGGPEMIHYAKATGLDGVGKDGRLRRGNSAARQTSPECEQASVVGTAVAEATNRFVRPLTDHVSRDIDVAETLADIGIRWIRHE